MKICLPDNSEFVVYEFKRNNPFGELILITKQLNYET